jgi:antitoxin VapB
MTITRVFMNGNSQAVRIPQELRLDATQVDIHRSPDGDLVIRPLPVRRGMALLQVLEAFDDDFIAALEQDRAEQAPPQDREAL